MTPAWHAVFTQPGGLWMGEQGIRKHEGSSMHPCTATLYMQRHQPGALAGQLQTRRPLAHRTVLHALEA
jgi:hypothetical protein